MQPVYGLTKGLSNKMITKLVHQILDTRPLHGEYLPEEIRERYQLSGCNLCDPDYPFSEKYAGASHSQETSGIR